MRLYFDADSESLFWDEFNSDPFTTDVTDDPRFRKRKWMNKGGVDMPLNAAGMTTTIYRKD